MITYKLYRKVPNDSRGWLSTTKGDKEFILAVLAMNMADEEFKNYDWKIEKVDADV